MPTDLKHRQQTGDQGSGANDQEVDLTEEGGQQLDIVNTDTNATEGMYELGNPVWDMFGAKNLLMS